ncbi:MAG: hypothetical protein CMM44_11365 [Rhodospirillaceae bacterium]|nr:hypothetical protein [Rhodospirillaceae bacterium]|tara:strand:+ start:3392 stop:3967 length:576 start_codon:yes stop_codon:yes gene_type:complete
MRLKCDGFFGAERFRDMDRPIYLGLYDIDNLDRLESIEYQKLKSQPNAQSAWMLSNTLEYERYTANLISTALAEDVEEHDAMKASVLRVIFFSVPDEREEDFNHWYDREHIPAILKTPGWMMVRRFYIEEFTPSPWSHLTLQYIKDYDAVHNTKRDNARESNTYNRLSKEPWFRPSISLYERFGDPIYASK